MKMKPIASIKADLGIEPNGRVQRFFTDTCYNHMDKYVPMETGNLRRNVTKTATTITYNSPYAHAQYVGYTKGEVKNYTTPRNKSLLGWKNEISRNARCYKRGARICQKRLII